MGSPINFVPADIVSRIVRIRGRRVLFDYDLAAVYGVTTKRLNQQVNRNIERFPADFVFHLETQELANLKLQYLRPERPASACESFCARLADAF